MKFLNDKGEIIEGTPISDELIALRDTVTAYIHEKVCHGVYHSIYQGPPSCRVTGNQLAEILDSFNGERSLEQRIAKEIEPQTDPEPVKAPQPVAAVKDDDIPF